MKNQWQSLAKDITTASSQPFTIQHFASVGGGCINTAYRIESGSQQYFVKFNSASKLNMFQAEAEGLAELAHSNSIRVPLPVCSGVIEQQAYIVLEYLNLTGRGSMETFAERLVTLHRNTHPLYGWHRDNTIGSTVQKNTYTDHWQTFWSRQRLGFQLELAKQNGARSRLLDQGEQIQANLASFFGNYVPEASLLHGDLWSGNYAFSDSGTPVVFDPATYYGDREADMAMTELFGGFAPEFYRHYQTLWPLDEGYSLRKNLYNLYHILNHFNMFGGGYESQAESICGTLLSSIK